MTEHKVTLSNRDGTIYTVNGRRPLLEQLRDQGVDLPYGCEYGGCITCAAKLVKGDIDQRRQVALNNRQIENGYVILCVARATCLLYTSPSPRDRQKSRMPSSA